MSHEDARVAAVGSGSSTDRTLPSRHHPPRLKKPEGGDQGPWPAKPAARSRCVEDDALDLRKCSERNRHQGESIDEPSYP